MKEQSVKKCIEFIQSVKGKSNEEIIELREQLQKELSQHQKTFMSVDHPTRQIGVRYSPYEEYLKNCINFCYIELESRARQPYTPSLKDIDFINEDDSNSL